MFSKFQIESLKILLSGILGHKDPNTITKYLSINHHNSSKKGLEKVDSILDKYDKINLEREEHGLKPIQKKKNETFNKIKKDLAIA